MWIFSVYFSAPPSKVLTNASREKQVDPCGRKNEPTDGGTDMTERMLAVCKLFCECAQKKREMSLISSEQVS
jgi:hypothetical protein